MRVGQIWVSTARAERHIAHPRGHLALLHCMHLFTASCETTAPSTKAPMQLHPPPNACLACSAFCVAAGGVALRFREPGAYAWPLLPPSKLPLSVFTVLPDSWIDSDAKPAAASSCAMLQVLCGLFLSVVLQGKGRVNDPPPLALCDLARVAEITILISTR